MDYILKDTQDIITGTSDSDTFFANGNTLNAGDKLYGVGGFDIFDFSTGSNGTFSGFELHGIERFDAFVAGGANVTFDMSGSDDVAQLILRNGQGSATWTNVDVFADDIFAIDTVGPANLRVHYLDAQLGGGNDETNLFVDSAGLNNVDISSTGGQQIETLNITALDGSTTINNLVSPHTNLNLFGSGDITVVNPLNDAVQMVDASGLAGALNLDFTDNDGGEDVTVIGSAGVNTLRGGTGDHTITTFGARDKVVSEGGDDVISTGGDRDHITVQGPGDSTLDGGDGNDVFDLKGDLGALDVVVGGDGNDELRADGGVTDTAFTGVTQVEIYTQNAGGASVLGATAQGAGINQIRFDRTGTENNSIDASGMDVGLKWVANYANSLAGGGSDTLMGGSQNDLFNLAAGFEGSDQIDGNDGFDEIKVRGDTTVGVGDFREVELITLGSAIGGKPGDATGNQYSITLNNGNAPTGGPAGTLTIDGSELQGGALNETLFVNGTGVGFAMEVLGGNASDTITTGAKNDIISTQGGNDIINAGAGADLVYGGLGADVVDLGNADTGADVMAYVTVADSSPSAGGRDTVTNFDVTNEDKIDLTAVVEAAGLGEIEFLGNYASIGAAQTAVGSGSGNLQVLYVQDTETLYADVNDDGVLNGDDLQILMPGVTGQGSLTGDDVMDGAAITATSAPAPAPSAVMGEFFHPMEVSFPAGDGMMMLA